MTQIALPVTGPLVSTYQRRIIVDAPRSLFYYVDRQRGGPIPDTPKARQWAIEKRGATHFDNFTFHRFNLERAPSAYKVGDFYCRISSKNYQSIDNRDIIKFVVSLLLFRFHLDDTSPCKLIYLGKHTLGLIIPASVFGIDHGGEFLPHLYKAFHTIMITSAAQQYFGSLDIQLPDRVDVENKRIGTGAYAVPFRIGEIDSASDISLGNLSRAPRAAPEKEWGQTIDPEILKELQMTALDAWREQPSGIKCHILPKLPPITLLGDTKIGASMCSLDHTISTMKCARKLVAWMSKRNLSEFCRRNALRVCPRSICCFTYLSEHEADGCPAQKGQSIFVQTLPILSEAAAPIEPADGSLHHPTLGKHGKTFGGIRALDDFYFYFS